MHLTKSGIIVFLALLLSAPGFASAQSVPLACSEGVSRDSLFGDAGRERRTHSAKAAAFLFDAISSPQTSTSLTAAPKGYAQVSQYSDHIPH